MRPGQKLWKREELILAINLYCKLPFGKLHQRNPDVISLAGLLGRTPGSVAYKLVNFASLDPSLQERGIKGASNTSNLDKQIWNEFFNEWDNLMFESEKLLAAYKQIEIEHLHQIPTEDLVIEGLERDRMVKTRVNQHIFRSTILAAYNYTCCITGINTPELLIAGHIRPWGKDEKNRLNPRNGITFNALHDKAFEAGFITITPEYRIKVSPILLKNERQSNLDFFGKYENQFIILPSRFLPDREFLKYHNVERFKQ